MPSHSALGAGVPRYLFNVDLERLDRVNCVQPVHVHCEFRLEFRNPAEDRQERADAFLHQARHVDPQGVILHLDRLVEAELLGVDVEVEPGERARLAVEELRWLSSHDSVQGRHSLLPVQQQLHDARGQVAFAAVLRALRFGRPDQ